MARPPTDKPPAKKAAPKSAAKKPSKGKKPGRSKGGKGGALQRAGRWMLRTTLAAVAGLALGGAVVGAALYRAALLDVDKLTQQGPVWEATGRVLSGPQSVWTGLQLTPEELATDLQAAGYVRVAKAAKPGDFQVSSDAVLVQVADAHGAGWDVKAGEALVTFQGGRVSSVSPKGRTTFAPAELASIKGANNEARHPVPLTQIPDTVVHAVLAMEDARFYDHEGVDPLGIARAVVVNTVAGGTKQGGSTLTQQLAKNLFLSQERTMQRKLREAMLAVAIERRLSKNEVLELYLNGIYLGQAGGASIYGVDQAARAYWSKPVDRLSVGEAAVLGGIISAPNRYSPLQHPDEATTRRDLALDRMVAVGWLDAATAAAEKKKELTTTPTVDGWRAPWAVDAAVAAVEESVGAGSVGSRGLTLSTTIQPALQRIAERVVAQSTAELDEAHPEAHGAQMALVAVRVSDGAVVAMVGGRDYAKSPYNRALSGRRQVGSTVKPLTALYAFEEDPELSPQSLLDDSPIDRVEDGKPWHPKNYDGTFLGPIPLRQALSQSRNIPAVLLAEKVGMTDLVEDWTGLGLSTATHWKSSALGGFGATPVELAGAYTVFPGEGTWRRPMVLRSAADEHGAVLWSEEPVRARKASPRAAFLTTSILQDVLVTGTGKSAGSYGVTGAVAGKTGTTDDARDAWMVGYTRDLVVVVWVGFDRTRALGLTGGKAALPAWSRFVAASGTMSGAFDVAADVEQINICPDSHLPAVSGCPAPVPDYYSRGHVPRDTCPVHGGVIQQVGHAAQTAWEKMAENLEEKRGLRKWFGKEG